MTVRMTETPQVHDHSFFAGQLSIEALRAEDEALTGYQYRGEYIAPRPAPEFTDQNMSVVQAIKKQGSIQSPDSEGQPGLRKKSWLRRLFRR